jgi:hypothetical protein
MVAVQGPVLWPTLVYLSTGHLIKHIVNVLVTRRGIWIDGFDRVMEVVLHRTR